MRGKPQAVPVKPALSLVGGAYPLALAEDTVSRTDAVGPDSWANPKYGDYYATSVSVFAAIRKRAQAVIRVPTMVSTVNAKGERELVDEGHPYVQLLRRVNPFWTGADLWYATSVYLDLWGSAYWIKERRNAEGLPTEIWVARPDRMKVLPDPKGNYIKGFRYSRGSRVISFRPEDVVWFRHFNPLDEYSGLSPMAPLRLSADLGVAASKSNRAVFRNAMNFGRVGLTLKTDNPTDVQIEEFYTRLKKRYTGTENEWRPPVFGMDVDVKDLGFSAKEMEYLSTLRWSLEEVARAYDVPKIMLEDLERSTYANVDAAERIFWRNISTYLQFLAAETNEMLSPDFGPNLEMRFDTSGIEALQPNLDAIALRQREDVKSGIVTVNEARAERGLEPVSWGNQWWASALLVPVDGGSDGGESSLLPSEALMARAAALHGKRLEGTETSFAKMQRALFTQQKREVLAKLEAESRSFREKQAGLFDPEEWRGPATAAARPVYLAILQDVAGDTIGEWALGIAFDVMNPVVQEWLDRRVNLWATSVNAETAALLVDEIREGLELGESVKGLQARVEKVFDFSTEVRTERIARTEANGAANRGALEAFRQSGVVDSKTWLATLDQRVRPDHLAAHGQTVPLEAPFLVGGESLMHPGDGSPANSINCRCATVPVISKAKSNGHVSTLSPVVQEARVVRVVKKVTRDQDGFPKEIDEERHYG